MRVCVLQVPILRITFKPPYAGIIVDLNTNNSVAIRNTHLLYYYSICTLIAHESSARVIIDALQLIRV
jgi:DNA polymerase sigma